MKGWEKPCTFSDASELPSKIIEEFIEGRYAAEYLKKVTELLQQMTNEGVEHIPSELKDDSDAAAFHGYIVTRNC